MTQTVDPTQHTYQVLILIAMFCIFAIGILVSFSKFMRWRRLNATRNASSVAGTVALQASTTSVANNVAVQQPATLQLTTDDPRSNTIAALQRIPTTVKLHAPGTPAIPLLFDGRTWHHCNLGVDGHWGIFGTTGSGKGNALQIVALATLDLGPQAAHLVILDAKGGLDYGFCKRIQHATLYKDSNLSNGCDAILTEMRRRARLLEEVDARNLHEYNSKVAEPLPLFVVIADEIADFSKEDRTKVDTFARMARAVGGVLFVATQYPTVEVLSNQTQSNVTNRCVFRLASSEYTRVALRRNKADNAQYEPAAIPRNVPGVAVLRQDAGNEVLGRAPELTDTIRNLWIDELAERYPTNDSHVSSVYGDTSIKQNGRFAADTSSIEPDTSIDTSTDITDRRLRAVKNALRAGLSKNDVAALIGGNRNRAYDLINEILEDEQTTARV